MGCPGHGAGTLQPFNASLPKGRTLFALLPSAQKGDKVTISIRKGITWHVQNSTNVTTRDVTVHGASLFGLSEFDGKGGHTWENVYLGRRQGLAEPDTELCGRAPGRLCFGILASNADAFHSSGCRRGLLLLVFNAAHLFLLSHMNIDYHVCARVCVSVCLCLCLVCVRMYRCGCVPVYGSAIV